MNTREPTAPLITLTSITWERCQMHCLTCRGGVSFGDGDCILLRDKRALETRYGAAFYARLALITCRRCAREFYSVHLDLVANPDVSEDWITTYFWLNTDKGEPTAPLLATYRGRRGVIPRSWRAMVTALPDGPLCRHCFGPFRIQDGWWGSVASCDGRAEWDAAATLIREVLPAAAQLAALPYRAAAGAAGPS